MLGILPVIVSQYIFLFVVATRPAVEGKARRDHTGSVFSSAGSQQEGAGFKLRQGVLIDFGDVPNSTLPEVNNNDSVR